MTNESDLEPEDRLGNETDITATNSTPARGLRRNLTDNSKTLICIRSGVAIADAKFAATVMSAVAGAVVGGNVMMSCGSSMMSTTGGAGAGAGAASVLPLVTQVQMLNQVGKIGGGEGAASVGAFSEGFGWANLEWGLAERMGYGDRMPTK